MSRVQACVLTFLAIAVLVAPPSAVAAGPVAGGVDAPGAAGPAVDGAVGAAGPAVDGAVGAASAPTARVARPLRTDSIDADRVEFRITVYENGSARWTFAYTRTLETDDEQRQFQRFAAEFNGNATETFRNFRDRASSLARTGRNETGRQMAATDFSKRAYVGGDCLEVDRCGTVRMSFTWTNFAREDGDRLIVDDVFDGGMYLLEDQQLVFEHGPDLRFASASPETFTSTAPGLADSTSITWGGERQFPDQRPRVVYAPADQVGSTPASTPGTPAETPTPGSAVQDNSTTWMLLVGLAVLAIGAGLALVWRRGEGLPLGDDRGSYGDEDGTVASEPAVAEEELLSDEDRVLQLLRENGGRMKQVNIVEETGWSKSKVSMLLSDMEDDDQISKLRVGRENIVSLVGHEPDAAGSPHDE